MTAADRNREREANCFAMGLLMPEAAVRSAVEALGRTRPLDLCDDRWVRELARRFRVPETLMAIRVGQVFPELF